MQIAHHLEAVQDDLAAVAAAGGAEESETVRRIAAALGSSLRLRLLEAVTEAAQELSSQLSDAHVEVRLEGGDPVLVVAQEEQPAPPAYGSDEVSARITLRLPEGLKLQVEAAATRDRMSINAWLIQAIARAVEFRPARGNRLTGFARS